MDGSSSVAPSLPFEKCCVDRFLPPPFFPPETTRLADLADLSSYCRFPLPIVRIWPGFTCTSFGLEERLFSPRDVQPHHPLGFRLHQQPDQRSIPLDTLTLPPEFLPLVPPQKSGSLATGTASPCQAKPSTRTASPSYLILPRQHPYPTCIALRIPIIVADAVAAAVVVAVGVAAFFAVVPTTWDVSTTSAPRAAATRLRTAHTVSRMLGRILHGLDCLQGGSKFFCCRIGMAWELDACR